MSKYSRLYVDEFQKVAIPLAPIWSAIRGAMAMPTFRAMGRAIPPLIRGAMPIVGPVLRYSPPLAAAAWAGANAYDAWKGNSDVEGLKRNADIINGVHGEGTAGKLLEVGLHPVQSGENWWNTKDIDLKNPSASSTPLKDPSRGMTGNDAQDTANLLKKKNELFDAGKINIGPGGNTSSTDPLSPEQQAYLHATSPGKPFALGRGAEPREEKDAPTSMLPVKDLPVNYSNVNYQAPHPRKLDVDPDEISDPGWKPEPRHNGNLPMPQSEMDAQVAPMRAKAIASQQIAGQEIGNAGYHSAPSGRQNSSISNPVAATVSNGLGRLGDTFDHALTGSLGQGRDYRPTSFLPGQTI